MQSFAENSENLTGEVTLLLAPAYNFLNHRIALAFRNQYPNATLLIQEKGPWQIVEAISKGTMNIGLILGEMYVYQSEEELKRSNLIVERLANRGLYLFVSANHPLAQQDIVDVQDTVREQFVCSTPEI